jgi:hypothetical protein
MHSDVIRDFRLVGTFRHLSVVRATILKRQKYCVNWLSTFGRGRLFCFTSVWLHYINDQHTKDDEVLCSVHWSLFENSSTFGLMTVHLNSCKMVVQLQYPDNIKSCTKILFDKNKCTIQLVILFKLVCWSLTWVKSQDTRQGKAKQNNLPPECGEPIDGGCNYSDTQKCSLRANIREREETSSIKSLLFLQSALLSRNLITRHFKRQKLTLLLRLGSISRTSNQSAMFLHESDKFA